MPCNMEVSRNYLLVSSRVLSGTPFTATRLFFFLPWLGTSGRFWWLVGFCDHNVADVIGGRGRSKARGVASEKFNIDPNVHYKQR